MYAQAYPTAYASSSQGDSLPANVIDTGSDFWGNAEYMWTLYYYESIPNGVKRTATFQEIDEYSSSSFNGIVDYNEWSEDVITYETRYKTETKYRTETRYRTVTKYKTVEI